MAVAVVGLGKWNGNWKFEIGILGYWDFKIRCPGMLRDSFVAQFLALAKAPETQTPISNPPMSNLFPPLPAKKSTKFGAGGVMSAVEEFEGGGQRGILNRGRRVMLKCETPFTG
jgi:hypothetical protein